MGETVLLSAACRLAESRDRERALAFLRDEGYGADVHPADRVFIAERQGAILGVVRLARERGATVLRGMRVRADARRRGTGTGLLRFVCAHLGSGVCYCVPYRWLEGFYGAAGFASLDPANAPDFLAARLKEYRTAGKDVSLMRRTPARTNEAPSDS